MGWIDTNDLRGEVFHNLLPTLWEGLHAPSHLDAAWFPGRQDIIHDEGHAPMLYRLAILLGGNDVMSTDVNRIQLWIVAKAHRDNMWVTRLINGSQPAEALALKILDLRWSEITHAFFLILAFCGDCSVSNRRGAVPAYSNLNGHATVFYPWHDLLYMAGSVLQMAANVPSIFPVSGACLRKCDEGRLHLLTAEERYDQDTVAIGNIVMFTIDGNR